MTKRYVVIRLHEVHRLSVSRWAVWGKEKMRAARVE